MNKLNLIVKIEDYINNIYQITRKLRRRRFPEYCIGSIRKPAYKNSYEYKYLMNEKGEETIVVYSHNIITGIDCIIFSILIDDLYSKTPKQIEREQIKLAISKLEFHLQKKEDELKEVQDNFNRKISKTKSYIDNLKEMI